MPGQSAWSRPILASRQLDLRGSGYSSRTGKCFGTGVADFVDVHRNLHVVATGKSIRQIETKPFRAAVLRGIGIFTGRRRRR